MFNVALSYALRHWRFVLLLVAITVTFFTVSTLQDRVKQAEAEADYQRSIAAAERQNADQLALRLQRANELLGIETRAREAADAAREAAERASEDRAETRTEIITVEREKDATLDSCFDVALPDSILRELP